MKKHSEFELWLHDDNELSDIHGANVTSRQVLQEWPLSIVELVTFNDGINRIYKAFRNLPIETEFYRQVQSRYIPGIFYNFSDGDRHWLLLENVLGQHPDSFNRDELLDIAHRARKIICAIGTLEHYRYDLSANHFEGFVTAFIELLRKLHQEEKLKKTDKETINRIEKALSHSEVLRIVQGKCALLHGDLKLNNILLRPDGKMTIIDWQSVLYGPAEIDVCHLMAAQNVDPVPIAGIGPEILRLALVIKWLADCIDRWIPQWADFYDGQIVETEKQMSQALDNCL
jgi:thiamine kinase-like enzyme